MSTIRDVARVAGVSKTTVSRVLNEPNSVKEDKRELVLAAIAQLDFLPNRTAQSLKSGNFASIALVVSDISNAFFAEIVRAVERRCALAGFSIVLCNLDNEITRFERVLEGLHQRGVDGLIVCGSRYLESDRIRDLLTDLIRRGFPLVLSGHEIVGMDVPTVVNRTDNAVQSALEHLWNSGRRVLGYMGDPGDSAIASERSAQFKRLARRQGFVISDSLIHASSYDFGEGYKSAMSLLRANPSLDALLCGGDQMAIGAMRALEAGGKVVPDDISVIGFDDTSLARYSSPALSSIAVHIATTGETAADKMIAAIKGEHFPRRTFIDASLELRASSQRV
jgi:LacI family transcriptional regulator